MRYCPHCGEPIETGMRFCINCGADLLDVVRMTLSMDVSASESESRPEVQREVLPGMETAPAAAPVSEDSFQSAFEESPQPAYQPTSTSVWQVASQNEPASELGEDPRPKTAPQPNPQAMPQPQTVQKWRPTPQQTPQSQPMSQPSPAVQPIARHIPQPMADPSAPAGKKSSKGALVAVICVFVVAAVGLFAVYHFGTGGGLQQQTQTAPAAAPSAETAPDASTTSGEKSEAPAAVSSPSNQQNANQQNANQQAPSNHQYSSQQNETAPVESKPAAAPVFTYTDASSVLPGDEVTAYYGPNNVVDNDFTTAWNEGVDGGGIGEWVSINANEPQRVSGVRIVNGYPKTGDIFKGNHRCRNVTISLSDGYEQHVTLKDAYREYQTFNFDRAHDTTFVRVRIDSIYQGARWDDTPICELQAF